MGLGKPQLRTKFEVAGFICYGNITEFVFKHWDKPKWEPLVLEKLILPLDLDAMFPTQCTTFVKL